MSPGATRITRSPLATSPLETTGNVPAVINGPDALIVQLAREPQRIERSASAGEDSRLATHSSSCRIKRHECVRPLVCVHPDHDHLHRPFVGYDRRSGSPADTPRLGRCHAPIKSRRRSSAAAGDTAKAGQTQTRSTGEKRVSPPPSESQTDEPDDTDRRNTRFSLRRALDLSCGGSWLWPIETTRARPRLAVATELCWPSLDRLEAASRRLYTLWRGAAWWLAVGPRASRSRAAGGWARRASVYGGGGGLDARGSRRWLLTMPAAISISLRLVCWDCSRSIANAASS